MMIMNGKLTCTRDSVENLSPILPEEIQTSWLEDKNERYRALHIPPNQRVITAIADLTKEKGRPILVGSTTGTIINNWFKENTKDGAHEIGSSFTGAFYFDASFWPVTIPVFYGTCSFCPLDSLKSMKPTLLNAMTSDKQEYELYINYWCDCFDYSCRFGHSIGVGLKQDTQDFLRNADKILRQGTRSLLETRPNYKAFDDFKMASEIFMKAYILQSSSLSVDEIRKFNHGLIAIADQCISICNTNDFATIKTGVSIFPNNMSDRYTGNERPYTELYQAASVAQFIAATIARNLGGSDSRQQMSDSLSLV